MHHRPIGPGVHGLIDYGFAAMNLLAPTVFGFKGSARAICYAMGASQGMLNALTDQPYALARVVPFRTHGELETPFVPSALLVPLVAGALRDPKARLYFLSLSAMLAAAYSFTDFNAHDRLAPVSGQRGMEMVEDALA